MNLIDIVILIVLIPIVIGGVSKGLINQVISFVALFIGTYISFLVTRDIGDEVHQALNLSHNTANLIVFAATLLAIWILLAIAAHVFRDIIHLVLLEWVDRSLGGVFALFTGLLVCGLLATMFDTINASTYLIDRQYLEGSFFYYKTEHLSAAIFPYLHDIMPNTGDFVLSALPKDGWNGL